MPPELELPGIDSAAPATPAAPAPSAPEDTSTQSASVQQDAGQPAPGAPTPESDAGDIDGEPAQPRRRDSGAQRRFGELLERERTAREESSQLRSMLAMVLQGQMNPAQARAQADAHQQEAPPRLEQFGNWADFNQAQARYEARQVVRQEFAEATRMANEHAQRQGVEQQQRMLAQADVEINGALGQQMQEAAARFPEYRDVMSDAHFDVPQNVRAAMALSGMGGDVALYLAKHPQVIRQLATLPDMSLSFQITRIANAMRSGSLNVSNVPAPGRPAGNRGTGPSDYPANATPEQHLAWRNRMAKAGAGPRK